MTARQAAREAADSVLDTLLKDLARKYSSPQLLLRDALRLAAAEAVEAATPFIAAAERERIIAIAIELRATYDVPCEIPDCQGGHVPGSRNFAGYLRTTEGTTP